MRAGAWLVPLLGLALLSATLRAGDEDPPEPVESDLEEQVEVEARRPAVHDVAAFATVIEPRDVEGRARDLSDLLRQVPGARVRNYGGLGHYATVSLRASTPEQVAIFVDGIPQNLALSGGVDLSTIPATQIERMTVYRGFGPAALGLGGMAGTIDIRTRAPSSETEGGVDLLVGELETRRFSTGWSIPTGERGAIRIGAEALASEGDFLYLDSRGTEFDPEDDVLRNRSNNDLTDLAVLLQGVWQLTDDDDLRVGTRVQREQRGLPGIDSLPAEHASTSRELNALDLTWTRRRDGRFNGVELLADALAARSHVDDSLGEFRLAAPDRTVDTRAFGLASVLQWAVAGHRPSLRVELRHEDSHVTDDLVELSDRGGVTRDLQAATVEDVITLGRVTLAPALRFERRRDDFDPVAGGLAPTGEDVDDDAVSGKLGVAWVIGPRTALRGSVGRFHRVPTLTELFGDTGAIAGNPRLQPEHGTSAELGATYRDEAGGRSWYLETVLFARDVTDWIVLWPTIHGVATYRNLAAAEVRGIEAATGVSLFRGLTLTGSLTWQQARNTSGGPFDGEQVIFTPEWLGSGAAAWHRGPLSAAWEVTFVGENANPADPVLALPARVIHDVTLSYAFRSGMELGVDVRNVFDRMTRDVARYPLPGRVVLVHVGWHFGDRR